MNSVRRDQEGKSVETKIQECLSRPDGVVVDCWLLGGICLEGRSPADCPGESRLVCVCVLQHVAAAQLCGQMRPLTLASGANVAQRWVLQSWGGDSHPPKEGSRVLPGEAIKS